MKNLFRKYYHSVLRPDEFTKISDFMARKKNESLIYSLMRPFWDNEMNDPNAELRNNPDLFMQIKDAILQDKQKTAQRKIKIYAWGLRVAAILIVALIISNIFFFQKSGCPQIEAQLQTITTPMGAKANITLPDGSIVFLNSGSTLSYPLQFGKSRPVALAGEAYFEVDKNSKPFIVSTDYGNVEVKGTSFNVRAYSDDDSFETTLEEGVVAFSVKGAEAGIILKPGEQIIKTANGFSVRQVETKYFTSWKEGKLIFNREPFPAFIKKLERWYNVRIEYADPKLDELWYTGTIEMESISEVMEMISKAAPVVYNFNNKTRVFTIKAK